MIINRIENNSLNFKLKKIQNKNGSIRITPKTKFYKDIDKYLSDKISKEEYLKTFNKYADKLAFNKKLNFDEKMYISDLKTTIDMADSLQSVSEKDLMAKIKELLEQR